MRLHLCLGLAVIHGLPAFVVELIVHICGQHQERVNPQESTLPSLSTLGCVGGSAQCTAK